MANETRQITILDGLDSQCTKENTRPGLLYAFHGHSGGQGYSATGMRLDGVSTGFNDKAFSRGVVAHGAPYVTPSKAGRSEGCPAMEPDRARRLLPQIADGGMVFLFAPDARWMNNDRWLTAN